MSDPNNEAGLGDFLEFASDDQVGSELLGRAQFGLVALLKPAASNSPDKYDLRVQYKLPQEMLDEFGKEGAINVLIDLLRASVDLG